MLYQSPPLDRLRFGASALVLPSFLDEEQRREAFSKNALAAPRMFPSCFREALTVLTVHGNSYLPYASAYEKPGGSGLHSTCMKVSKASCNFLVLRVLPNAGENRFKETVVCYRPQFC